MDTTIHDIFYKWDEHRQFSGVFTVSGDGGIIFQRTCGYRNKAEQLPNQLDTAFAIASGTKFFTALSVCKLIDNGCLSLNDRICDLIPHDLKSINKEVTVLNLLTHTSGIGDYIDEEASSDYFDILKLYENRPVHKWDSLAYYLPMFNELPPKFSPGERFGYSNAGFILLGLVVEAVSKQEYHQYVKENIILPLSLTRTGFFRMNNLPGNTALGYVYNEMRSEYETNILYMPVVGGSDGGIFTCVADIAKIWGAAISNKIFSAAMRDKFLAPHVVTEEQESLSCHCGLGVFMREEYGKKAYYIVGGDFGVDFFSAYFPQKGIVCTALGNTEMNTWQLFRQLFKLPGING